MNKEGSDGEPPLPLQDKLQSLFQQGKAIFVRIESTVVQRFASFKNLPELQQLDQITALQYWIEAEGPQNKKQQVASKIFLKTLKQLQSVYHINRQQPQQQIKLTLNQQKPIKKEKLSGVLMQIKDFFANCKLELGWHSKQQNQQAKKKEKIVSVGQDGSLQAEQEEMMLLKQE